MGRTKNGALIIGDANHAIDKILQKQELFGLTRFSAHMDVGGFFACLLTEIYRAFWK